MTSNKTNCWQFTSCGREPGGSKIHELGVCPAAIAKSTDGIHGGTCGGRACWAISGTLCEGKLQGTIATKFKNCMRCAFYQQVMTESSGNFLSADQIIALHNASTPHSAGPVVAGNEAPPEQPFTVLTNITAAAPAIGAAIVQFLEQKALRVVGAAGLQATCDLSAQTRPDIILLAVTVEEMNDNATARTLRQLTQATNTPIIFITESPSRTIQRQGFKLGALGVIHTEAANFWEELGQKVERVIRLKLRMNGLTALLIDSNAVSNRVITACLEQQGATVLHAKDETAAKTMVMAGQTIDLVISEGGNAAVNGIDLCRYLRTLPRFATTPIILLFPEGSRDKVLDFFQAGATDYIIEPCPREELLARLLIHIEAQQGLRELNRQVRKNALLLDSAGEGIIGIDPNGQITFVNQAAARILGYLPAELQGKNLHGLTHHTSPQGEPYSPLNCPIQRSLEDGAIVAIADDIFWRSDNTSLPVKYISTPIIDNGAITGAVVTFSDITAEKREAALRQDLEQIMRHDLKTPLNGIIGIPAVLMDDANLSDRQRGLLELLRESGYRMLQMINDSLNILKMEKGVYEFCPVPVDLLPVIRSVVEESMAQRAGEMEVRITVDGMPCRDGERFMVLGEKLLCYSMLANLITNAIEASPRGGAIDIALNHGDPLTEIIIHNQGTVAAEIRGRFFDKYATAGKSGGTGLGTYSARMIATTHRGSLTMTSDQESGTSLVIKLPTCPCGLQEGVGASDEAVTGPAPRPKSTVAQ